MKKIILSLAVIAMVGAVAVGVTRSFFSDTETSTGNTFTAGAIDLKVDSECSYNGATSTECGTWALKDLVPQSDKFFNFDDIKPGDVGENTISLHVINNDAWVCAEVSSLIDNENGINEPESAIDTTSEVGELSQTMEWTIWKDDGVDASGVQVGTACDNIQQVGEPTLTSGHPTNGTLALYDSQTGNNFPLAGGSNSCLGVAWTLPASSGNETQTDSLTGNISFRVEQSRNNGNFRCVEQQEPEIITTTGTGWSPESTGALNQNRWLAKSRYGGVNTYELEVGFGPGLRSENNHNTWSDNVGETFTLNYNNTTKTATLTVGSDVSTYQVTGAGTPTSVGITAKGSASYGITKFTGAMLDGNAIPDTVATAGANAYTSVSGPAVFGDFVLTGTVTLDWETPVNEGPTLQVDVKY